MIQCLKKCNLLISCPSNFVEVLSENTESNIPSQKLFVRELYPYQKDGVDWLSFCNKYGLGTILADDMGLGKTIQAISIMLQRAKNGPSLVVAPASVCPNWMKEIKRFAPNLKPSQFGLGDRKQTLKKAKKLDVIITTYGLLQSESEA